MVNGISVKLDDFESERENSLCDWSSFTYIYSNRSGKLL